MLNTKIKTSPFLTHAVPPVVLLHHVLAVEHLVADFTGVELLAVLLLVLGEVAVGGEEPRADVALERLVVWKEEEEEDVMNEIQQDVTWQESDERSYLSGSCGTLRHFPGERISHMCCIYICTPGRAVGKSVKT